MTKSQEVAETKSGGTENPRVGGSIQSLGTTFKPSSIKSLTLLRAPKEAGAVRQVLDSLCFGQNFAVVEDGIYFTPRPDPKGGYSIQFLNSSTGIIERVASIERPVGFGLAVSPDRHWILYAQVDTAGSDLMLLENFR